MNRINLLVLAFSLVFTTVKVKAQSETEGSQEGPSQEELAKAAANPIANMITLPFQFNFNTGIGEHKREQSVLNLQPTIPYKLAKNWNVINRIIIPIISQPMNAETGSDYGLGNINLSMMAVPKTLGIGNVELTYGFGPAFSIPTTSAPKFGPSVFAAGPALVGLMISKHWVVGLTVNQTWSYNTEADYSVLFAQYFIVWNIKKGWFVNTTPTITANWNAEPGEQWTIPVGAGFGRIIKVGNQPIKLMVQAYDNVQRPTGAAEMTYTFMAVFMFP